MLRSAAIFAVSHLGFFLVATAVSIFAFDRYESTQSATNAFQTMYWLGVGSGVLVFFGGLFGAIMAGRAGRSLHPRHAIPGGALTAILLLVLMYLRREFAMEGGLFAAVIGCMLIPFVVSLKLSDTH